MILRCAPPRERRRYTAWRALTLVMRRISCQTPSGTGVSGINLRADTLPLTIRRKVLSLELATSRRSSLLAADAVAAAAAASSDGGEANAVESDEILTTPLFAMAVAATVLARDAALVVAKGDEVILFPFFQLSISSHPKDGGKGDLSKNQKAKTGTKIT